MSDQLPSQLAEIKGERFLVLLFRTIQAIKVHDDENELVKQSTSQFITAASELLDDGEFTILILDGGYYVQRRRFRYHKKTGKLTQNLLDTFTDRGLYGFTFYPALLKAKPADILKFLRWLNRSFEMENPYEWLSTQIADHQFSWIELLDAELAEHLREEVVDNALRAKQTYLRSLASVREVTRRLGQGSRTGIWKSKRVIQNMVDLAQDDEALSIGMATIKHYDDYTYVHSVNVAVLSVCLGNRLGLSKEELWQLGICGLFHDLGKVEIDPAIIQKAGPLNDQEWGEVRKHPLASVHQILKLNTTFQLKSKLFIAPLEHHLNLDLSGYPAIKSKQRLSLFGRILKIADVYDAITSPRAYRRFYYSPEQVLKLMVKKAGTEFDPVLLKVFVTMLGRYPIGTLVVLDTKELGLICGHAPSQPYSAQVVLLEKKSDGAFLRGQTVSLDDEDPSTGIKKRKILRSFHPAVCGLQPAEFFLDQTAQGPEQAGITAVEKRS